MSNVVRLNVSSFRQTPQQRIAAQIRCFAEHRRVGDDVFWLKENAELLNILECTGAELAPEALAPHRAFHENVVSRLEFFPQYYRFLLSICLDLEDLGLGGDTGEALVRWAAREGLAEAELSDLQRAEARRLMMRRNVDPMSHDTGLEDRLRRFMGRTGTFAMPNKKAAYELTHIVFYLSEYGRRDPGLDRAAITSLEYTGLLAYLDQNSDLLSEVCVALRHAGRVPPATWETWLERVTHRFEVAEAPGAPLQDDYHDYFVCNWLLAQAGREAFVKDAPDARATFRRAPGHAGPLREISECIFNMAGDRCGDWQRMRGPVNEALDDVGREILAEAEQSTGHFDAFFAGFARTGLRSGSAGRYPRPQEAMS